VGGTIPLGGGRFTWAGVFRSGGGYLTDWPPANDSQMVLIAVLENGWGEDELAAKLRRVLDLNGRKNGLESLLVNIQAEAIQAAQNGK
jgi:hypothetical protein